MRQMRKLAIFDGKAMAVQFQVRLVQVPIFITSGDKEGSWVIGHGPDDLGLYPQEQLDYTQDQYAVDEQGPVQRYGFAYDTLPGHAESGEERFTVERREAGGAVWYDILAFSRPRQLLARLGYPFARGLQKRFARDSAAAMRRAVGQGKSTA
jgi:hypothetical protein